MTKDSQRAAVALHVVRLLREEREKRGLSRNELAKRSGLSQSMISLLERDLRNPTLETLLRITEALEADLAKIIARARRAASSEPK